MKVIFRNTIVLFLMFNFIIFGVLADINGVWTKSEDIRPGIFGEDEKNPGDVFIFNISVYFKDDLYIKTINLYPFLIQINQTVTNNSNEIDNLKNITTNNQLKISNIENQLASCGITNLSSNWAVSGNEYTRTNTPCTKYYSCSCSKYGCSTCSAPGTFSITYQCIDGALIEMNRTACS